MPFLNYADRKIFYRMWDVENPRAIVVFFHGGGEHSGLYHRFAHALNDRGFRVWAADHIGHGHTPGTMDEYDYIFGFTDNASGFVDYIKKVNPDLPMVIVGHSMGGATASQLMSRENAPEIDGLVLAGTPWDPMEPFDHKTTIMSTDEQYLDELAIDAYILPKEGELDSGKINDSLAKSQELVNKKSLEWEFPVLFVNGELDPISLADNMKNWAKKMKNARAVCFKGGHHDIICDFCHEAVEEIIGNFVYEVTCPHIKK